MADLARCWHLFERVGLTSAADFLKTNLELYQSQTGT